MSRRHVHASDEELLQRALDGAPIADRELERCDECVARRAELAQLTERLRGIVAHESELDARRDALLAERIIAATTRAVPRPTALPRRAPPVRSPRVRRRAIAAAVLAALALPFGVWAALDASEPSATIAIETASAGSESGAFEHAAPAAAAPGGSAAELAGARFDEPVHAAGFVHDFSLRERVDMPADDEGRRAPPTSALADGPALERVRERRELLTAELPAFAGDVASLSGRARLLALRSLIARAPHHGAALLAATPGDEDSELDLALWCEAALDHWVLHDELLLPLEPMVRFLARRHAASASPSVCVMACLDRAERCGLLDDTARGFIADVRARHPELVLRVARTPFDAVWRAALRAELAGPSGTALDAYAARVIADWSRP